MPALRRDRGPTPELVAPLAIPLEATLCRSRPPSCEAFCS